MAAVVLTLLAGSLTAADAGDLDRQITAGQSAAGALSDQIHADTNRIQHTSDGLQSARASLVGAQADLRGREAKLGRVQRALVFARDHLVRLENRMHEAASALSDNLVARYEDDDPDVTTVVLQSDGFSQLLEQLAFLRRVAAQDAAVLARTRTARVAVRHEVIHLASLEQRDRKLTAQVLSRRNEIAAWQAALLSERVDELRTRAGDAAKLRELKGRLRRLEAKAATEAAAQARRATAEAAAAASADSPVDAPADAGPPSGGAPLIPEGAPVIPGGIAVDTGGMVQPPPGAPAAVGQVIAAGNAIATLPYIWGGGHGSFQASGYDCSGSVSYALAAAGLVTSPMVSGDFESWGDPGPGRWITIYANADHVWMVVAGWRFDTVAQSSSGTRWARGGGEFTGFVVRHPPGL